MIDFLLLIFCVMLWIQGINCLFSEGHILEDAGDWIDENLPQWMGKPLVLCPMCQSSVHGSASWFIYHFDKIGTLWFWELWPVFCVSLCGLNFVISKLTNRKREIQLTDDPDF